LEASGRWVFDARRPGSALRALFMVLTAMLAVAAIAGLAWSPCIVVASRARQAAEPHERSVDLVNLGRRPVRVESLTLVESGCDCTAPRRPFDLSPDEPVEVARCRAVGALERGRVLGAAVVSDPDGTRSVPVVLR
jgi:hypothetical protein